MAPPSQEGKVTEAVIVGGGFIGLDAAVALADMWGVKVSVVEMMDQILPGVLSHSLALMAAHDCQAHKGGRPCVRKSAQNRGHGRRGERRSHGQAPHSGPNGHLCRRVHPQRRLAKEAGLEVAPGGAIVGRTHALRTPHHAGGDCVGNQNIIPGKHGQPSGHINRQGVIGTNLAGGDATFPGYVGSWAVKLFDMAFCGVGLTVERARKEGYDALSVGVEQLDHAHFYPEKSMMTLELVVDKPSRRVLGLQGGLRRPRIPSRPASTPWPPPCSTASPQWMTSLTWKWPTPRPLPRPWTWSTPPADNA